MPSIYKFVHPWGLAGAEVYCLVGHPTDADQVRDVVNDEWDDISDDTLDDWALELTPDPDNDRNHHLAALPTGLTAGEHYPLHFYHRAVTSVNDKANDPYLGTVRLGYTKSNLQAIGDSATLLAAFAAMLGVIETGTVVDDAANTASTFETDLTETDDDHYERNVIAFIDGDNRIQARKITAYDGTTKFVTVDSLKPFEAEPTAGDTFVILGLIDT